MAVKARQGRRGDLARCVLHGTLPRMAIGRESKQRLGTVVATEGRDGRLSVPPKGGLYVRDPAAARAKAIREKVALYKQLKEEVPPELQKLYDELDVSEDQSDIELVDALTGKEIAEVEAVQKDMGVVLDNDTGPQPTPTFDKSVEEQLDTRVKPATNPATNEPAVSAPTPVEEAKPVTDPEVRSEPAPKAEPKPEPTPEAKPEAPPLETTKAEEPAEAKIEDPQPEPKPEPKIETKVASQPRARAKAPQRRG